MAREQIVEKQNVDVENIDWQKCRKLRKKQS
jgi:hypothetical protein